MKKQRQLWINLYYAKPSYSEKVKFCYKDTGSSTVTVYLKTDDIDKYIAEDVETRFDT